MLGSQIDLHICTACLLYTSIPGDNPKKQKSPSSPKAEREILPMKKLQKLLTLGLAAAGAAVLLTGCGKKALEDSDLEAASWDQITEAARDTTVTFYGWGGDENRNNWLNTTVADHVKENYGICLLYTSGRSRMGMPLSFIRNENS